MFQSPGAWERQISNNGGQWPDSDYPDAAWPVQRQPEGFSSTAWRAGSPPQSSQSDVGFYGTTVSSPQSALYSPNAFPNAYSGQPNSAPLPPPPQREKMKRSFSLVRQKKDKEWWYPRDDMQYNEYNQAQRPRDWRQDYEVHPSLMKRLGSPKNRSDTRGGAPLFFSDYF